jgi:trimethylamine--corrinoid protein Co-methyltransferase
MFLNRTPPIEPLSPEAIELIDKGWRRLLAEIGIELLYEPAREIFREAGQRVEGTVVFLDPDFVSEQVAKAPSSFELAARNPKHTLTIGGDWTSFVPIYGAPFVLEDGARRDATLADFDNLVRLSQHYPEIDSPSGVICEPNDRPLDSRHLDMTRSLFTYCDKPPFAGVISRTAAEDSVAIAEIVFGGREAIEERPVLLSIINANSPLRYDDRMLGSLMVLAEAGQANIVTPSTILGAMAPVSLPAAMVQTLAEAMAAIALIELIRPGCPVVVGFVANITDMRSGSLASGSPETAIGVQMGGQLARHYGLPWRAGGHVTSSQVVDAQAGYESMRSHYATFESHPNVFIHAAGALNDLLAVSFEKFVVDIELLRSLRAQFTPLEVDEASLAYDAHVEVGHGGHFFGAQHTLERFREVFYRPYVSTTDSYERWVRLGSRDAAARARELVEQELEAYEQPKLDDAVQQELDEYVDRRRHELGD